MIITEIVDMAAHLPVYSPGYALPFLDLKDVV